MWTINGNDYDETIIIIVIIIIKIALGSKDPED